MNQKISSIILIIVVLGVIFGLTFYFSRVPTLTPPSQPIDKNLFRNPVFNQLKAKKVSGQIPVTVPPGTAGREDPFNY